jgi:hypothetical protein
MDFKAAMDGGSVGDAFVGGVCPKARAPSDAPAMVPNSSNRRREIIRSPGNLSGCEEIIAAGYHFRFCPNEAFWACVAGMSEAVEFADGYWFSMRGLWRME